MGRPVMPSGKPSRSSSSTSSVARPAERFSTGPGSAARTSTWMKSAAFALPVQRFRPVTTKSSPSRTARVATPARSDPASGSDRAIAPIHSPSALRRSSSARRAGSATSVPAPCARAMMLPTLIHARASSSATMQHSNAPSPRPPRPRLQLLPLGRVVRRGDHGDRRGEHPISHGAVVSHAG